MGSNPVEALIFFRLLLSSCLNWKIYCDDHTSLHLQPQYKYELFHIYFTRSHLCYKSIINYDLDITNILVLSPQIRYNVVFDITNPPFNEQIWPVPSGFVKSRFHYTTGTFFPPQILLHQSILTLHMQWSLVRKPGSM